jgi:hypothetical protein
VSRRDVRVKGRLMSVAYTADAVIDRTKTVTRRLGWKDLKPGDKLWLCRKVMGRRKGEPLERLAHVEVLSVRRESLAELTERTTYGRQEMAREGFPGMDPAEFIRTYFTDAQGIAPDAEVTRIKWRYL